MQSFYLTLIIIKLIINISELQLRYFLLILELRRALAAIRLLLLMIFVYCGHSISVVVVALTARLLLAAI